MVPPVTSTAMSMRQRIVDFCEWGVENQPGIHYAQVRPIPIRPVAVKRTPIVTDCSGFATMAYRYAGAPDPNGNKYNGQGYTGTLLKNGNAVKTPMPGDLLIYGPPGGTGDHVVIYMYTWHGAWIVCSHGQEIGPLRMFQHKEEMFQGYKPMIRSYLPRK